MSSYSKLSQYFIMGILIVALPVSTVYSLGPITSIVDTPTAIILEKGSYDITTVVYNEGGLIAKGLISLHPIFYLGINVNFDRLIGKEKPKFYLPGISTRVQVFSGSENFPFLVAIGYDLFYFNKSFYEDQKITSTLLSSIAGPYTVVTMPFFFFGSEQHIHFGIRMPFQPSIKAKNIELFGSVDIPIGDYFIPMIEINNIFFNENIKLFSINFALRVDITYQTYIKLVIGAKFNKLTFYRSLQLEYIGNF